MALAERQRWLRGLGATLGLSAVALLAVLLWLRLSCGTLHAGLAFLSGDRLLVDAASRSTGEVRIGEQATLEFHLSNRSSSTITIFGAKSSCTCTATGDLPMTLPPSSARTLRVTYQPRPGTKPGIYPESLRLYTDYPKQATLPLVLVGRVAQESAAPSQSPPPTQGE